jgi:hypothetical protein
MNYSSRLTWTLTLSPSADPLKKFRDWLAERQITRPDARVLEIIVTRYASRLLVCPSADVAQDLYREAKETPLSRTRAKIEESASLTINGPAFGDHCPSILAAAASDGVPKLIKVTQ